MAQAPAPLIDAVEAFLADNGMAPSAFGRQALRDPRFVDNLRNGRRLWPETEDKVRQFMADHASEQAAA